jgi:ABC-type dipeptide/oligopeptide/nickel transport system ATPase subunit
MNVVKVRNAYKSYGKGNKKHDVLKGLSLNIEEGTM